MLDQHISPAQSVRPQAHTASANGLDVDLANFDAATVVFEFGVWTDGVHTATIEEAPDDGTGSPGTYAVVAAALLDGTPPVVDAANEDDQIYLVGYLGNQRFIRGVTTVSGATTGAIYGSSVVRGKGRKQT